MSLLWPNDAGGEAFQSDRRMFSAESCQQKVASESRSSHGREFCGLRAFHAQTDEKR